MYNTLITASRFISKVSTV